MKTLEPGDKLNCYVIDRNGQQSNLAIQALVVTTKQSLYADSLYSTVLCIIDERIEQLLEDHHGGLFVFLFHSSSWIITHTLLSTSRTHAVIS